MNAGGTPTTVTGRVVEAHGLADDRGVAAEAALPERIADDGDRLGGGCSSDSSMARPAIAETPSTLK